MVAQTTISPAQVNGITNGHTLKGKAVKSKNQLRRLKQKQKKASQVCHHVRLNIVFSNLLSFQPSANGNETDTEDGGKSEMAESLSSDSNVEYVPEQLDVQGSALEAFSDVFARFQLPPDESSVRR